MRTFRVVFMRRNEDQNNEPEYYHDGISITTDAETTEDICVDLMNGLSRYINENNVEAVADGVSEIYEEE